jgi:hypothetical protein
MIREGIVVIAVLAATGCGGEDESAAEPAGATPEATRTATPTPTPTAAAAPTRARSVRECARLWNADALEPESYQVSANQFVAELAPVRVHVAFQRKSCFVVAPIGDRRIAISVAAGGRRPFSNPDRRRLQPGERVPYNARANREGRVVLDD